MGEDVCVYVCILTGMVSILLPLVEEMLVVEVRSSGKGKWVVVKYPPLLLCVVC